MQNDITRLIIFSCHFAKEISEFVEEYNENDINITVIKTKKVLSATSVIKELDSRNILKEDFLLINSHIVSNIDIRKAIIEHNNRKNKDAPMMMTKLFYRCPVNSPMRSISDEVVVVANSDNMLLKYDSSASSKKCKVNDCFEYKKSKHSKLSVRMDLIDCGIEIISPCILSIMEDYSGFESFKDDFVNHVTKSEIIVDKVYMHEVDKGFFYKVSHFQNYFLS